jgi:hypothetical protein
MPIDRSIRAARFRLCVLALGFATFAGCSNSNNIPLIEFPNGPPPPPPAAKFDKNGPQGAATSQGDPMIYSK